MDRYLWNSEMFRLRPQEVADLERGVERGNPLACYRLGRFHISVRPQVDSVAIAAQLFEKAERGGVADATAALALMWKSGDMQIVNHLKYKQMLAEALEHNSSLAAKCTLLDMIYGSNHKVDIEGAMESLNMLMAQSDEPTWYYIMGCAVEEQMGKAEAVEWYRRAVDAGMTDAYIDLAFASTMDDEGVIVDYESYTNILYEGIEADDGKSLTLWALEELSAVEATEDEKDREHFRSGAITDLENAIMLGDPYAAFNLGNIYLYGSYDIPQSTSTAWSYYAKGAILGSALCYEAMYDMVADGAISKDSEYLEYLALYGTRCGSELLMSEVVKLYKSGALTEYATEIEQYYLPRIKMLN